MVLATRLEITMKFKKVRHLWGFNHPIEEAARRAAEAGYDALEMALLGDLDQGAIGAAVEKNGLELIVQIHTKDFVAGDSPADHLADFRERVARAKGFGAVFVNSHSGRDEWSFSEAKSFFSEAVKIAEGEGISVSHETHRSRVLFNPYVSRDLCEAVPGLRLTADYSHWVCVCERIFAYDDANLKGLSERVDYVHGRVGHSQGPQVNDPRSSEHRDTVAAFRSWWSEIWKAQASAGRASTYFCPEFGPPPYLPTLPFTGAPVTNLNEVCNWMAGEAEGWFGELNV